MKNENNQQTLIRWLAVIIAIVIFVFSLSTYSRNQRLDQEENEWIQQLTQTAQTGYSERILEPGNPAEKIIVIPIKGVMLETANTNPLETAAYDHNLILESLQYAIDDASIKGILLEVDSSGGGAYETAEIRNKVRELKETRDIPIYTSMGNMAASGGYYVSALTDRIYASEETTTGSIGAIGSGMDVSELLNDWGISVDVIKSGEYKDAGSGLREMTEEERQIFQDLVDESFDRFIDVVDEGRALNRDEILELADGRIYSGAQAETNGLIDAIGYYEDALTDLTEAAGSSDPSVITLLPQRQALFSMFTGDLYQAMNQKSDLQIVQDILQNAQSPRPLYLYGGN